MFNLRLATPLIVMTFMASCAPTGAAFNAVDVTGSTAYSADFRIADHTGKTRTMADFHGKAVALFFGYTHCPDVCPTTLSDMKKVAELLGNDADRLQVLFITVDPARDTAAVLSEYVPSFNRTFLGLRGDDAATEKIARDFRVIYRKVPGKTADGYTVDHSAGMLIFDPAGRLRLFVNYGLEPEKIAADVRRLL